MTISLRDAEDAVLHGITTANEWFDEWQKQWNEPLLSMQEAANENKLLSFWEQLDQPLKDVMRQQDPQKFAAVEARMKKIQEKFGGRNATR